VSDKIVHVTDDSFEQDVIKSDIPVLVDYWAEWCGPCKMIAPILEEVVDDYAGKLKIAKTLTFKDKGSDDPADWVLIEIDKDGRLDYWPRGFADYTESALSRLLGYGKDWTEGVNRGKG
jgi:thiol-disulfide isomerase/thioredoxin